MKEILQAKLKEALKARDQTRLNTIRAVMSACQYEEMEKGVEKLPEASVVAIVQREIKKRREEIEFAAHAGRGEAKEKALQEIAILEEFLPKQLSAEAIEGEIKSFLATAEAPVKNMGGAMKFLKEKFAGQYDPKVASEIAKRLG